MNDIKAILQDIILETQTAMSSLEYDDPVCNNFEYVENLAKHAMEIIDNN